MGQVVAGVDAVGNYTLRSYDAAGRVLTEQVWNLAANEMISGMTYEYDYRGNVTKTLDAAGNYTQYLRDGLGRVVHQISYDVTTSSPLKKST